MSTDLDHADPERELKFHVTAAGLARLGRHPALAAASRPVKMRSVYFDTCAHALRRQGVSLRVRTAGKKRLQTVKGRPKGAVFSRDEWESAVASEAPDLEAAARTPAGDILATAKADLVPVAVTTVQRTVKRYQSGASVIEVSLDKGEVRSGDRSEPISEIELELKSGEPAALFELARVLGEAAALRLSFETKADRGYRLAGAEPLKAEPVGVTPQVATGQAFHIVARHCVLQISANAERLIEGRNAEAIHQTRVGVRRLRAALSIFNDMVADTRLEAIKAELKWLAGALGEARDLDVLLNGLRDDKTQDAGTVALRRRLEADQVRAHKDAAAAAASPRYAALLLDLAAWVEIGPWTGAPDPAMQDLRQRPAPDFAAETLRGLRKSVRKKGRELQALDEEGRHRLRIHIKKLRYAAEFFGDTFGPIMKRRRKFVQTLRTLQDLLGELNDIASLRERGKRMVEGRGQSARAALAMGVLIGRRQAREKGLLRDAVKAFAKFDKADAFWTQVWTLPPADTGQAVNIKARPNGGGELQAAP